MKNNELTTHRLCLKPITDADVASLVRHWGDSQVRRYLWDDKPVTVDMVNAVVTTSDQDFLRHGYGIWTLRQVEDERLVGICGLRVVKNTEFVEILYSLRPRFWRNGYATEAAKEVLEYAFGTLNVTRVLAAHDRDNLDSEAVMQRLGMHPVKAQDTTRLRRKVGASAKDLSFWQIFRGAELSHAPRKASRSSRNRVRLSG